MPIVRATQEIEAGGWELDASLDNILGDYASLPPPKCTSKYKQTDKHMADKTNFLLKKEKKRKSLL